MAFLYCQSYSLQLAPLEAPLEKALLSAQKGAALEPENQLTRTALALDVAGYLGVSAGGSLVGGGEGITGICRSARPLWGAVQHNQGLQSRLRQKSECILSQAPHALRELRAEAVLVDQTIVAGGTVAEHLRLPFVTVRPNGCE